MDQKVWCRVCCAGYPIGFACCPRDGSELRLGRNALVGSVLDDRYRIEAVLGGGAVGVVYRATHVRLPNRRLAIKMPFGDVADEPAARGRFAREAEASCRLSHPNVVAAVDLDETAHGLPYLVMELADGPTLSEMIEEGPMPLQRALGFVAQIARGLAHAHQHGVVHRDLKPSNIIVQARERPRIADFGVALLAGGPRYTDRGRVVGTPAYMAPEQALDDSLDGRIDVFALGVIAYELVAGVLPHDGEGYELLIKNVNEPAPLVRDRAPDVPVSLDVEAFLQLLLQRDRAQRPSDANHIAAEAEWLAAQPPPRPSWFRERVTLPPHLVRGATGRLRARS